jgi:hypothetical protein
MAFAVVVTCPGYLSIIWTSIKKHKSLYEHSRTLRHKQCFVTLQTSHISCLASSIPGCSVFIKALKVLFKSEIKVATIYKYFLCRK